MPNSSLFSAFVGICFTLNYIIGTGKVKIYISYLIYPILMVLNLLGFLTLPWAFNQTGPYLGFTALFIMTIFSLFAIIFILESMARAEELSKVLKSDIQSLNDRNSVSSYQSIELTVESNDNHISITPQTLDTSQSGLLLDNNGSSSIDEKVLCVGTTKFELTELSEMFLGHPGRITYTTLACIYLYTALWVYATVFGMSLADHLDIGKDSYIIYVCIFSIIVIPLSLKDMKEQIWIQVFLSVCRILMVLFMVGTILIAQRYEKPSFGDFNSLENHSNSTNFNIQISKIYLLLPMAAYANIFHHSIPALSELVPNKKLLHKVFIIALIIAMLSYTCIGCVISNYFQNYTNISSNLNWSKYYGQLNEDGSIPLYARIISSYIVLFPAFDVSSAFPLNAITLSNNIMSTYYGHNIHLIESSKHTYMWLFIRLIAIVPPLLGALLFSSLGEVTSFAGITGFAIAFIFPSLLAYYSNQKMIDNNLIHKTVYSYNGISKYSQILTLFVGIGLIITVSFCLIVYGRE